MSSGNYHRFRETRKTNCRLIYVLMNSRHNTVLQRICIIYTNLNDGLLFGGQILLDILFEPSQHHGLQDGLQLLNLMGQNKAMIT